MGEAFERKQGNDETSYIPFLAKNQQSTDTTDNILPSYTNYRSPMVDCGISDPPDALEWHETAMVGLTKKQVRRK